MTMLPLTQTGDGIAAYRYIGKANTSAPFEVSVNRTSISYRLSPILVITYRLNLTDMPSLSSTGPCSVSYYSGRLYAINFMECIYEAQGGETPHVNRQGG